MIAPERLQAIKAQLPALEWSIHYPQYRSMPHIVGIDKESGYIIEWIAQGLWKDDESDKIFKFIAAAPDIIRELINELEALRDDTR